MSLDHRILGAAAAPERRYHRFGGVLAHRHVIAAAVVLGLSDCNEPPSEPAASPAAVSPVEPPTTAVTADDTTSSTARGGLGQGGLTRLTREVIEQARREAADPLLLIPNAADYVVDVRPAELLAHDELRLLWSKAEASDPDIQAVMDVMRGCLGRLEAIDRVVVGFIDKDHVVMVAHAKGLGTEATWRCLRDETTARGKSFDLELTGTPRGKGPQILETGKDGGDLGYFVDDDTAVVLTKEWDPEFLARMRGEGTPAIEGELAATAGRMDQDASLRVVGRITGDAERDLVGTPMAGIDDVSLTIRVRGQDLELHMESDAGEPTDATRVRDELTTQVESFKGFLPMLGFPSSVAPKIAFETEGDLVSLRLSLTGDELRGLREGIERSF